MSKTTARFGGLIKGAATGTLILGLSGCVTVDFQNKVSPEPLNDNLGGFPPPPPPSAPTARGSARKQQPLEVKAIQFLVKLRNSNKSDVITSSSALLPYEIYILVLSKKDIEDIKKVVSTEVPSRLDDESFKELVHGVVDTLLNRRMCGQFGSSIKEVADYPNAFSKINGPSRLHPYGSVDKMPSKDIVARVAFEVEEWIKMREDGVPSSVGTNLNYANPNFSDKRNLKWIEKLDGPTYGTGISIHRHGTTPELEPYRPEAFLVRREEDAG